MVPTAGDIDHVMAPLEAPFTTPFTAVDCPPLSTVEVGLTVTVIVGINAIVALAALEGSVTLFAVTVIFCCVLSVMGAV
jgi:hypothetical protein